MIRYLGALILGMHGAGHALFLANAWGYWKTQPGRAGLFATVLSLPQTTEGVVGLVWIVPLVGFVLTTVGMLTQDARWGMLAIASAIISSILIVAWWSGLNTSSAFFALVVNAAVVVVLLWRPALLAVRGV